MLSESIALRAGADVFSRPEPDGRMFLQRPGGREGHLVRLMGDPASRWWSRIEGGVTLGALLSEAVPQGCEAAEVKSFVASLIRDGFIPVDDAGAQEASRAYPAEVSCFEDPWAYQFSQPSLTSPWYVLWEVTDKCSQHCSFCYNPERENQHVGLGQAEKTVADLVANRVPYVTLLGGEPLSNVHIEEIIRMLSSNRIYTKVITSGVPLTPVKVQRLRDAGLHQVALSLDALTPELNDMTRGPRSFEHFMRARRVLGREIPCVSVSLTVTTATLEQLDRLDEFCREWDIDDVYLSQLRDMPGAQYPPQIRPLSREQIAEMNDKAEALNRAGTKVIGVRSCSCGRSSAVIQPDGTLRACPFSTTPPKAGIGQDMAGGWAVVAKKAEQIGAQPSHSGCYRSFSEPA